MTNKDLEHSFYLHYQWQPDEEPTLLNQAVHKKTGNVYYIVGVCLNCTNKDDGDQMVMYRKRADPSLLFVREMGEFVEKFCHPGDDRFESSQKSSQKSSAAWEPKQEEHDAGCGCHVDLLYGE